MGKRWKQRRLGAVPLGRWEFISARPMRAFFPLQLFLLVLRGTTPPNTGVLFLSFGLIFSHLFSLDRPTVNGPHVHKSRQQVYSQTLPAACFQTRPTYINVRNLERRTLIACIIMLLHKVVTHTWGQQALHRQRTIRQHLLLRRDPYQSNATRPR